MSDDRLSHEEFLKELAAFDKVLRTPTEPACPPPQPPDLGLDEPLDLVRPSPLSRDTEALRVQEAPMQSQPSRISGRWWAGALSVGVLVGGLFGWWLASNPIVRTPSTEPAASARSTAVPAATAPVASELARPLPPTAPPAVASREVASTIEAARASAAEAPVERRIIAAPPLSRPSVPSATAGGAAIPSLPIAPAPSIAPPLPSAPVAVRPSMPPAAPPASAAAGALAAAVAADEAAIETTLRKYEDAYERLDAKAAMAVWPTVDQRALSRAFAGLVSQDLVFRGCEVVVRVGASTATASCRGTAEYVQKVGNARPHVEPREWIFTLNKREGEWRIEAVDGRR